MIIVFCTLEIVFYSILDRGKNMEAKERKFTIRITSLFETVTTSERFKRFLNTLEVHLACQILGVLRNKSHEFEIKRDIEKQLHMLHYTSST